MTFRDDVSTERRDHIATIRARLVRLTEGPVGLTPRRVPSAEEEADAHRLAAEFRERLGAARDRMARLFARPALAA